MKKFIIGLLLFCVSRIGLYSMAQENLYIIPEADSPEKVVDSVTKVGQAGGHVWEEYNNQKKNLTFSEKLASGIMDRSTLLDYMAYLIKFMSQAGIFVGACFIIYAGYIYASSIFTGKDPSAGNTAIKNAIIGVVVITFSYAIMKAIMAAFLT